MSWCGCCSGTSRWRAPSRWTRRCGSITPLRTGAGAVSRCACVLPGAGTVEPGRDQAAWRLSAVMMQCASRYVGVSSAGCGVTSGEGCSIGEVYRRARCACRDLSGHGGITTGMGIGAAPWRAKFGGGGGGGGERFVFPVPYHTLTLYTPQARNTESFARIGALCGLWEKRWHLPDWLGSPLACPMRGAKSRDPGISFFLGGFNISSQPTARLALHCHSQTPDGIAGHSESEFRFQGREI